MFSQQRCRLYALVMMLSLLALCYSIATVDSAPTSSSNNNSNKNGNNSRLIGSGLLSNLFRRQTGSSGSESSTSSSADSSTDSSTESEVDDPQAQTELEAQKFMDSLPNPGANNESGPTTFRERVSESFGLLRDGVSNQFRSLRENFSETVEDLRDTWSSNSE